MTTKTDYGWGSGTFDSGMLGDNTDLLANQKRLIVDIYHIPSHTSVQFKAFVTSYQDKFASEFNTEEVYGRMDPIQTFKQTKRNISLGWDVVSASIKEAKENLERCTKLFQMLYPSYDKPRGRSGFANASTITAGPIFRLKFVNLIQDVKAAPSEGNTASAADAGLVGTISGFTYEPDFDSGFFDEGIGTLLPQTITLAMGYTVNHTHPLGWEANDAGGGAQQKMRQSGFPYNVQTGTASDPDNTGGGNPNEADAANGEVGGT